MADLKISQLTDGAPAQTGDQIPVARSGNNVRVTVGNIADVVKASPLTVPGGSSVTGEVRLAEDTGNGTNYVALKAAANIASNVTFTLPAADGSNGQALTTNGSGTLAFSTVSASPAGNDTEVQFNDGGAFGGDAGLTYNKSTDTLSTKVVALGTAGSALGQVTLSGNTSGTVTIQPAAAAGTYTLTLPTTDGDANQVLQTDGSGALSWVDQTTIATPLTVPGTASATGELRLAEDTDNGTNYVALAAPALIGTNLTLTLPATDGTNGQALTTNGSGTLAFSTVTSSPAGSDTQVQFNDGGAFGGDSGLVFNKSTDTLSTKIVALGTAGSALGQLTLSGNTSGTVTIQPAAAAGTYTLTLPTDDGTAGQFLKTDGNGVLSWDTTGGGGGNATDTLAVFTPLDNQPPASNFATLDTRNSVALLDFDDATDESAVFVGVIPEGANLGSGIIVRLSWAATSATSGDCVWDVSFEKTTGQDIDSDSFDTIQSGTTTTSGTSGVVNTTAITITTIDSLAAGDCFRLKVTRDANNASDTMTGDAELVAVEVRAA